MFVCIVTMLIIVKSFTGVVVSDLHSGSFLSPMVPHFETTDGQILEPNSAQKEMYDAWQDRATEWNKPDILILLGDMINQKERNDAGMGVWSGQPLDWLDNAEALVNMYNAKEIAVVRGTGRHVMIDGLPSEEVLARRLHAKPAGHGKYKSAMKFIVNKWDFRMHFAHHVPSSQTEWYLPTPISKEGIRLQMQQKRLGVSEREKIIKSFTEQILKLGKKLTEEKVREFATELMNAGDMDAIFRGHNHYWLRLDFKSQHLVSCPCWQLATEWMHKKSGEPLTDIGAVRFRLTDEPDDFGERFRVQKQLYPIIESGTRVLRL